MANPTAIRIGQASTTTITKIQRFRVDWTVPALSSGASDETTVTVTGLSTSDVMIFQPRVIINSTVAGVQVQARCSTANELVLSQGNISVSSLSGSTQSGYLLVVSFQ
jgi:hypothetical protein